MNKDSENLKEAAKEYSKKLTKLGTEISKIQFSYKIQEKKSKEYWNKRIKEFRRYNEKSLEYYNQAYSLINLINKEESHMFMLSISKLRQLGLEIIRIMEKIEENPSIIDSKDKQQSQWSKELKKQITEQSNKCLNHEKSMNSSFREFYEKQVTKVLE
ncbi:MAG: hypothetical protein ACRBB5_04530 [Nitrosopumilus sp.]